MPLVDSHQFSDAPEILLTADTKFSFEAALAESIGNEGLNNDTDDDDEEEEEEEAEKKYAEEDREAQVGDTDEAAGAISSSSRVPSLDIEEYQLFSGRSSSLQLGGIILTRSSAPRIHQAPGLRTSNKRKNKAKSKANKRQRRQEAQKDGSKGQYHLKTDVHQKLLSSSLPTEVSFSIQDLPIASTGYVGLKDRSCPILGLQAMLAEHPDFEVIKWNGRDPKPIVAHNRIIAVLAGRPNSEDWDHTCDIVLSKLREARAIGCFSNKKLNHRRGQYATLTAGISYGGGQKKPRRLHNLKQNATIAEDLLSDRHLARIAGFSNGCFASWFPNLYTYYEACLEALLDHDPTLLKNWIHSVWAGVGLNCGPKTITKKHTDNGNLAFGMCSVTPVGKFDHTRGGHLVLWSLKLIVQFPAGSTILLPSATIPHSNISILDNEERCSITQFTAGGIFRWVEQGFQPSMAYMKKRSIEEERQRNKDRISFGLSLFSTLESLPDDQKARNAALRNRL